MSTELKLVDPPEWMSSEERAGYALAQRLAHALRERGLEAHFGASWDGPHRRRDSTTWFLYPRANGGVGVHYERSGAYDQGALEPDVAEAAVARVAALPPVPSRSEVWAALQGVWTCERCLSAFLEGALWHWETRGGKECRVHRHCPPEREGLGRLRDAVEALESTHSAPLETAARVLRLDFTASFERDAHARQCDALGAARHLLCERIRALPIGHVDRGRLLAALDAVGRLWAWHELYAPSAWEPRP